MVAEFPGRRCDVTAYCLFHEEIWKVLAGSRPPTGPELHAYALAYETWLGAAREKLEGGERLGGVALIPWPRDNRRLAPHSERLFRLWHNQNQCAWGRIRFADRSLPWPRSRPRASKSPVKPANSRKR